MDYFYRNFMNRRREQFLRSIHSVEVQSEGTWYRGEFNKKEVEGDTLVVVATFPVLDSKTCTITASRLIDVHGEIAAYQQRVIEKISGQGCLIRITVPIYEVSQ